MDLQHNTDYYIFYTAKHMQAICNIILQQTCHQQSDISIWLYSMIKGCFPLGGIFHAQRNFSLYFFYKFCLRAHKQRKIVLRTENSVQWKTALTLWQVVSRLIANLLSKHVVHRLATSCFNKLWQVCEWQVATSLIFTDLLQLNEIENKSTAFFGCVISNLCL